MQRKEGRLRLPAEGGVLSLADVLSHWLKHPVASATFRVSMRQSEKKSLAALPSSDMHSLQHSRLLASAKDVRKIVTAFAHGHPSRTIASTTLQREKDYRSLLECAASSSSSASAFLADDDLHRRSRIRKNTSLICMRCIASSSAHETASAQPLPKVANERHCRWFTPPPMHSAHHASFQPIHAATSPARRDASLCNTD